MVLIMEGYLDYGDENWHELPDSESHGVVVLDAYQGYPETNRSTQLINQGSGYDNINDNNYGVVYDAPNMRIVISFRSNNTIKTDIIPIIPPPVFILIKIFPSISIYL